MNDWKVLGIEPTEDLKAIKKAFAAKSRTVHPEEHPDAFNELSQAYARIVRQVRMQRKGGSNTSEKEPEKSDGHLLRPAGAEERTETCRTKNTGAFEGTAHEAGEERMGLSSWQAEESMGANWQEAEKLERIVPETLTLADYQTLKHNPEWASQTSDLQKTLVLLSRKPEGNAAEQWKMICEMRMDGLEDCANLQSALLQERQRSAAHIGIKEKLAAYLIPIGSVIAMAVFLFLLVEWSFSL